MLIRFSSHSDVDQTIPTSESRTYHNQYRNTQLLFRCSLWVCLAISICHVLSLTLEVTFDGNWYIGLAHILGSNGFPQEWDFLRGPLYPAILKLIFWLCGWQAMAVIGLHACLAFLAIYLLGSRVRNLGRPLEAALGMILLTAYPMLIVYEHMLLTEVGTFFFLSLFVYLLTGSNRPNIRGALTLSAAITAGYYYRSSLLYLAPLAAVIYSLPLIQGLKEVSSSLRYERWREAFVPFLIIAVGPFLLAYPWQRYPMVSTRTGDVLLYGLVKSSVLPLDDPILGSTAPVYRRAIEQSTVNGHFPAGGLQNGTEWSVIIPIHNYVSSAGPIFFRVIRTHPIRYLQGVGRNFLLFSGLSGFDNDNARFRDIVLLPAGSKIDPGPAGFPALGDEWKRTTALSFTSRVLRRADRFYNWIVLVGFFATILIFFMALLRLDRVGMAFSTIPLAFLLLHTLLLISEDRMALPSYPILLMNLLMLPTWIVGMVSCS